MERFSVRCDEGAAFQRSLDPGVFMRRLGEKIFTSKHDKVKYDKLKDEDLSGTSQHKGKSDNVEKGKGATEADREEKPVKFKARTQPPKKPKVFASRESLQSATRAAKKPLSALTPVEPAFFADTDLTEPKGAQDPASPEAYLLFKSIGLPEEQVQTVLNIPGLRDAMSSPEPFAQDEHTGQIPVLVVFNTLCEFNSGYAYPYLASLEAGPRMIVLQLHHVAIGKALAALEQTPEFVQVLSRQCVKDIERLGESAWEVLYQWLRVCPPSTAIQVLAAVRHASAPNSIEKWCEQDLDLATLVKTLSQQQ